MGKTHLRTEILSALLLLLVMGCASTAPSKKRWKSKGTTASKLEVERVEKRSEVPDPLPDRIHFKNGTVWDDVGYFIEPLATLSGPKGVDALIFSASECVECDADRVLATRSTATPEIVTLPFPGTVTLRETGEVKTRKLHEYRAWQGSCFKDRSKGIVHIAIDPPAEIAERTELRLTASGITPHVETVSSREARAFKAPAGCQRIEGYEREAH